MSAEISDAAFSRISEFVASHFGLHFPRERRLDLQRALYRAAQECGCRDNVERYIQELLRRASGSVQMEVLASHLTIGETYFFREPRSLEVFEKHIVPELSPARRAPGNPIRIWSAGCATGEEPYSVAIVLSKLTAGLEKRTAAILATDLNAGSLRKASEGVYGEWSFRGTPAWVRSTYCKAVEDGRWAVVPSIRKMVSFAQLNLMDDAYPPVANCSNGFDVIFCRNVLMYFNPEGIRRVVRQLHRCLATDGWLIVSAAETSQELFSEFATVNVGGVTLYRKRATHSSTIPAVPAFDEDRLGVQLLRPARILSGEPEERITDEPVSCESTARLTFSHEQALELYEQARYGKLEESLAALPVEGNHASALLLLARAYANQGKLAEALGWCDKAVAADRMTAAAYYLRATILQEQGSVSEVVLALKQALYVEPQFVLGHFSLGNLALQQGRQKESDKHFDNVLLLLAQYGPQEIVPESDGLSARRLREMIVSQRGGMPSIELSSGISRRGGELSVQRAGTR